MNHRDTYFTLDVAVEGDTDLIVMADDDQLTRKATEQLRDRVGDPARWFEPAGVGDATVTFELRVGSAHRGDPTDAEAIHGALRCVRRQTARVDGDLDCSRLRFDRIETLDDGDSVNDTANDSVSDSETSSDSDTEHASDLDTGEQTGLLSGAMGGGTP